MINWLNLNKMLNCPFRSTTHARFTNWTYKYLCLTHLCQKTSASTYNVQGDVRIFKIYLFIVLLLYLNTFLTQENLKFVEKNSALKKVWYMVLSSYYNQMNLHVWVHDCRRLNNAHVYDLKSENEIFSRSIGNLKDISFYMYFYLFIQ